MTAELSRGVEAPARVRVRHGLDELVEASGHHPFVRCEVTDDLAGTWWQHDRAVAFQRVRRADRRTVNLLGDDDGVTTLLDVLPDIAAVVEPARRAFSVSVPQHLEPRCGSATGSWTAATGSGSTPRSLPTRTPPTSACAPSTTPRGRSEITAFLAAHSPTADTHAGTRRALVRDRGRRRVAGRCRRLGQHPRRRPAPLVRRRRHAPARRRSRPHDRRGADPLGRGRGRASARWGCTPTTPSPARSISRSATTASAPGPAARSCSTADACLEAGPQRSPKCSKAAHVRGPTSRPAALTPGPDTPARFWNSATTLAV